MSDLKELNKEQSEIVQRHSEYMKSEVGYALALEECTDILMDFHNEMKQANGSNARAEQALPIQNVMPSDLEFKVALTLLRDLADLQNGAPLETYRKEWEEVMNSTYEFLNNHGA